jgi:hypothetical protein
MCVHAPQQVAEAERLVARAVATEAPAAERHQDDEMFAQVREQQIFRLVRPRADPRDLCIACGSHESER